jgi:hypothetical protein
LPYAFPPGAPLIRGRGQNKVRGALERLIDRHGSGNYADYTLKLTFPPNPNGVYLWKRRRSRRLAQIWRASSVAKAAGLIFGKRCGAV